MKDKKHILIVEDNEADRKLISIAFKKAEFDNTPQIVHNGQEAIAYLEGEGPYSDRAKFPLPSVMLLDLNMPRKGGFEVLQWVRAHPLLKRITVVILTASIRMDEVERAFDLGASSFLVKPVMFEDLVGIIRTLRDWLEINHFPPLNESVKR